MVWLGELGRTRLSREWSPRGINETPSLPSERALSPAEWSDLEAQGKVGGSSLEVWGPWGAPQG